LAYQVPRLQGASIPPFWLLVLAICHGLLYLALIPPWQHYDEPTHFEYARLIAIWNRVPNPGEYDLATRREIADSLYRFQAVYPPGVRPDVLGPQAPDIGIDQRVHPPLYYMLVALPIGWLQHSTIETQLYAARLPGLALYTLIVLTAWRIGAILEPEDAQFRNTLALLVLFTPAFTDMMGAVNNDVLVNFALAASLPGCVLLIRDGLRPLPLALALLGMAVGIMAKRTAMVWVVPLLLALFWSFRRQALPLRSWLPLLLGSGTVALLLAFRPSIGQSSSWLQARDWLIWLDTTYLRVNIDATIRSLSDIERSSETFLPVLNVLFGSMWQRFGWGEVRMGMLWERTTLIVTGLAAIGLIMAGARERLSRPIWWQRCVWLFVGAVLAGWLAGFSRVHPLPPADSWIYIPVGRYMHSILIPTLTLMVLGIGGLLQQRRHIALALLLAYFILIDTVAWMIVITRHYYG
jgi:4-amino-4-deoxy-L-arabinose transferase-like glycosyltransferase